MRVCRFVVISRGGGSIRQQPHRTESCQCVSGKPWACHGALQDQLQPLRCVAALVKSALGPIAGLGRKLAEIVAVVPVSGSTGGGSTRQSKRTEPCECVSGQPWTYNGLLQGQMQPLQCDVVMEGPAFWAVAGLGGGYWGLRFGRFVVISRGGGSTTRQPQRTESCQCVSGYPWGCCVYCEVKCSRCCVQRVW